MGADNSGNSTALKMEDSDLLMAVLAHNGDIPDLMSSQTDQSPHPSIACKHLPTRRQYESNVDVLLSRSGYGNVLQFPYTAVDSETPQSAYFASLLPSDAKREPEHLKISLIHFREFGARMVVL